MLWDFNFYNCGHVVFAFLKIHKDCRCVYNPEINKVGVWQLKRLVWESHLPSVPQICREGRVLLRTLPRLINIYIFPLGWTERGTWRKRKMVSAHYSLRITCHLPFKMHMYFISALRCHKLNAKGPLIWPLAGEPNVFLWFICSGTGKSE